MALPIELTDIGSILVREETPVPADTHAFGIETLCAAGLRSC